MNTNREGEGADEPADTPPIEEMADFALNRDPDFAARVARGIQRTETATSLVDLSSRGFLTLIWEYLALFFRALFPDPPDDNGVE